MYNGWRHIWVTCWRHRITDDLGSGKRTDRLRVTLWRHKASHHIRVMTDINVITSTLTANNRCTTGSVAARHRPAITRTYEDSNLSTFLNGAKPQPAKLTRQCTKELFVTLHRSCCMQIILVPGHLVLLLPAWYQVHSRYMVQLLYVSSCQTWLHLISGSLPVPITLIHKERAR